MSIENCLKIFDEKQQCLAEHLEKQKELDQARFEETASQQKLGFSKTNVQLSKSEGPMQIAGQQPKEYFIHNTYK